MKLFAFALALAAAACSGGAPDLAASRAWARETLAGQDSAAAYLTIANRGRGNDRLVAVSTPAARDSSLHRSSSEGGISRMRPLKQGLEIPAGGTAALGPGGDHIMLSGLHQPLRRGTAIQLRLEFERSPDLTVQLHVLDAAGAGPAAGHAGH